ncbi:MAG: type II toxin-antitoxin system YafQ family toxin [bacterium]
MLSVRMTSRFRKSLKKVSGSGSFNRRGLKKVVETLSSEKKLDKNYKDHSLSGDMVYHRECHIEFDLLLIYRIEEDNLVLVNIGSHPELFG